MSHQFIQKHTISMSDNTVNIEIDFDKGMTFFICNICNYVCKNLSNLTKHQRTHSGEKPYLCNLCDYSCCDSSNLRKHMKRHSESISYFTSNTSMSIHNPGISNLHLETELKKKDVIEKKFECSLCNYSSAKEPELIRHSRVHTGEKPYECILCDYKTSDKGNLTKHKRRHTGEYPYTCEICDYCCRDSSNLKKHMRIHTGEKPYTCKICNFKSACPANLNAHEKTHNGEEKRFPCDRCSYRSVRAIDLRRHMRIHGEKTYACKKCDFKSVELKILRRHVKTHVKLDCNICQYKASTADELKLHLEVHSDGKTHYDKKTQELNSDGKSDNHTKIDLLNIKRYPCNMCEHEFMSLQDLHKHAESHVGHYLENFKHFLDV